MSSRLDILQTQGVNDVFEYNEIHLDSRQADNRGEFTARNHPRFAITPPIPRVIGIKVLNAQIPFSWNIINESNNTIIVNGVEYRIPTGNYSVETFLTQINNMVTPPDPGADPFADPLPGVYFSFNERTGYADVVDTRLAANDVHGSLVIPANGPITIFGLDAPAEFPITPERADFGKQVNLSGANYLLLTSQSLAARLAKNIRINGETTAHPLVLAKIPVTTNPGGVLLYNDTSPGYCFDMGLDQLQNIDLMILNGDDLKPITPQSPWAVSLMVLSQRETSVPRIRDVPTREGTAKRMRIA